MKMASVLFSILGIFCLTPWVSSSLALLAGVVLAVTLGNPFPDLTKTWTSRLLAAAVVGLGAGMNLSVIGQVGLQGIGYTVIGLVLAFILGNLLGRLFKTPKDTSLLISVGTAICGGSAIAAVAPVLKAKPEEVSISLGIIFILNALALFIFPPIGHVLNLSETQFGLWSALAIHDTSSVVGATLQYGAHALQVGTTVKLARALWIVPIAFTIALIRSRADQSQNGEMKTKSKKPWFILGFILAAALVTYFPVLQPAGHRLEFLAQRLMVLTLFLIGTNLTRENLKRVGVRPFFQGLTLWFFLAAVTLAAVDSGLITLQI